MNIIKEVDRYIKRKVLAELVGTQTHYLSITSKREQVPEGMEVRVKEAVRKIIEKLNQLV